MDLKEPFSFLTLWRLLFNWLKCHQLSVQVISQVLKSLKSQFYPKLSKWTVRDHKAFAKSINLNCILSGEIALAEYTNFTQLCLLFQFILLLLFVVETLP